MKKTLLILLFFALNFVSFSQERPPELQKKQDSLLAIWDNDREPDSTRAKAYYKYISKGYLYSNPDSASIFIERLITFSESKNSLKSKSFAYELKGYLTSNQGNYTQALKYLLKSSDINDSIGEKRNNANIYGNTALIYNLQANYPKALEYLEKSSTIFQEHNDLEGVANCHVNIGLINRHQGNYPDALNNYQKAIKTYRQLDQEQDIIMCQNSIGELYIETKEYDKAIEYFSESLNTNPEPDNKNAYFSTNGLGKAYYYQGNYKKAEEYYLKALKLIKTKGDKINLASSLINVGTIYHIKENYSKALEYYQESLNVQQEIGDKLGTATNYINIGSLYMETSENDKALEYLNLGLKLSQEIGAVYLEVEACKLLYAIYKDMKKGDKALEYHEKMIALQDSMKVAETNKKLQQMEFQQQVTKDSLEVVERERQVKEAHQAEVRKKDKNKNIAIAAGIFFLLVAGGLYGRWRYTKKAKAVIEKEKDRSENLLLNILPAEVAEELKEKGEAEAQDFEMVSILFSDFKGFTGMSEKMTAKDLVANINQCFKAFDGIMHKYNIEKIKTIGDAYMAAGGLPVKTNDSVKNTVLAALEMQGFIIKVHKEKEAKGEHAFEMRVGIHTGPVVAGIVGVKKFQYDVWGDTVNTASRMESSGEVGKVNISETTYNYIKNEPEFTFESRGKIQAKGKGEIEMYFVALA